MRLLFTSVVPLQFRQKLPVTSIYYLLSAWHMICVKYRAERKDVKLHNQSNQTLGTQGFKGSGHFRKYWISVVQHYTRNTICNCVYFNIISQQTQNFCITFIQRRPNVFDVGPTLYKCYTNVFVFTGMITIWKTTGNHDEKRQTSFHPDIQRSLISSSFERSRYSDFKKKKHSQQTQHVESRGGFTPGWQHSWMG